MKHILRSCVLAIAAMVTLGGASAFGYTQTLINGTANKVEFHVWHAACSSDRRVVDPGQTAKVNSKGCSVSKITGKVFGTQTIYAPEPMLGSNVAYVPGKGYPVGVKEGQLNVEVRPYKGPWTASGTFRMSGYYDPVTGKGNFAISRDVH